MCTIHSRVKDEKRLRKAQNGSKKRQYTKYKPFPVRSLLLSIAQGSPFLYSTSVLCLGWKSIRGSFYFAKILRFLDFFIFILENREFFQKNACFFKKDIDFSLRIYYTLDNFSWFFDFSILFSSKNERKNVFRFSKTKNVSKKEANRFRKDKK